MLKSKIVSSPAGSGKTERLAQRYIDLLKQSVKPERILTITFTEKAAAEMKERIFKILKQTDTALYDLLKEKSLQLRIQTIDSFCFSLLRRFAVLNDYQPDLEVLIDSDYLQALSMHDTLIKIAENETAGPDYNNLINLIIENKFKGWSILEQLFNALYSARLSSERAKLPPVQGIDDLPKLITELKHSPITKEKIPDFEFIIPNTRQETDELKSKIADIENTFLTSTRTKRSGRGKVLLQNWIDTMYEYRRIIFNLTSNFRFENTFSLFTNRFLAEFDKLKKTSNQVDFADLELLTYDILTNQPEWSNILYLFDEHTDHILVDEFQDTSFLQWAIISKLAEEWLSGMGAKRERGIEPTIFLVGDDKQSIYLFRNAHPEIFDRAQKHLESRLTKDQFELEQVTNNFRSLSAIIGFTNHLFPKLMLPSSNSPAWMTRYKEFECKRENPNSGIVEIILTRMDANMAEARTKDAELVAQKILTIIDQSIVFDKNEEPHPARFEDITILFRSRTHLTFYENALRKYDIPFIVVKGIGFYDTLEITLLRAILNFLVDTTEDFSLYLLLKSPLFDITEKEILFITQGTDNTNEVSLWNRLKTYGKTRPNYQTIIDKFTSWLRMVSVKPMAEIIENMFDTLGAWKIFWEPQRTVNIKKFLRIVEDLENNGAHPLMIADYFDKNQSDDEAKANVNTEGRNEVKLMTIHAAKGLQFPIVFLVGLDTSLGSKGSEKNAGLIINEVDENNVWVLYEPDSALRKQSPIFIEKQQKEYEEEKRLFYVAVTRARDALFLTGIDKPKSTIKTSRLSWLKEHLPIIYIENNEYRLGDIKIPGLSILSEKELNSQAKDKKVLIGEKFIEKTLRLEPITEEPEYSWQAVGKQQVRPALILHWKLEIGNFSLLLGDILHKIFEKISKSETKFDLDDILSEAKRLFVIKNVIATSQEKLLEEIHRQYQIIRNSEISDIISPHKESYSELPFILKQDKIIYSGRIDRIIIKDNTTNIYDYKTFPVKETELKELAEKYKPQLSIYQKAASEIFPNLKPQAFLVFTAIGKIYDANPSIGILDKERGIENEV